eukprot:c6193_g1_i2.p1 GENE.c6193_g1_i2~~c6193_g1_i2.p1  ORF type:complete len:163 (-),score=27.58 c6193_g1_i2:9-497(-)
MLLPRSRFVFGRTVTVRCLSMNSEKSETLELDHVVEMVVQGNENDVGVRNWLGKRLPAIPYSLAEKLLRKKQIRVVTSTGEEPVPISHRHRMQAGEKVLIPKDLIKSNTQPQQQQQDKWSEPMQRWAKVLKSSVIFQDDHVVAINKPFDLPSQGKHMSCDVM